MTSIINQNELYYINFEINDPDGDMITKWGIQTNASFLSMNNETMAISGTPTNDDVGFHFVNVTAEDPGGLHSWIYITLEVINVNDEPEWINAPNDTEVNQGKIFTYQVEAKDIDIGDRVSYQILSDPEINISIDSDTGSIEWNASLMGITPDPDYLVNLTVFASDGEVEIFHSFILKIIPNPIPISKLISPKDNELVISLGPNLIWQGEDDSKEISYDLYLSESFNDVSDLLESTLIVKDLIDTSYQIEGLDQGKTYYWTVIPKDIFSIGICFNGVLSFTVNTIPHFDEIPLQSVYAGEEFRLHLNGSDKETKIVDLNFTFISGPDGMELIESTNYLVWTPSLDQIGNHLVEISLFDGFDYTNKSFEIKVIENEIPLEPDDKNDKGLLIGIILGSLILIAVILLILFIALRRKNEKSIFDEEEGSDPNLNENQLVGLEE